MRCYIVIFEVGDPTKIPLLIDKLRTSFKGYCPLTAHSWAILTDKKSAEVRDLLRPCLGTGDRLFVFRSGTEGAWLNAYGDKNSEWLKKNL